MRCYPAYERISLVLEAGAGSHLALQLIPNPLFCCLQEVIEDVRPKLYNPNNAIGA